MRSFINSVANYFSAVIQSCGNYQVARHQESQRELIRLSHLEV